MTTLMDPVSPCSPLPDIKRQFVEQFYEPVARELPANMQTRFEMAKERYEAAHGHQFPYEFRTFCREYYK